MTQTFQQIHVLSTLGEDELRGWEFILRLAWNTTPNNMPQSSCSIFPTAGGKWKYLILISLKTGFSTGLMSCRSPNHQCQSTEECCKFLWCFDHGRIVVSTLPDFYSCQKTKMAYMIILDKISVENHMAFSAQKKLARTTSSQAHFQSVEIMSIRCLLCCQQTIYVSKFHQPVFFWPVVSSSDNDSVI